MTRNESPALARDVRTLFALGAGGDLTDGELLERSGGRDAPAAEAALGVLVERHGRMVWGVCRRILADPHDAEDAFQATFLVLVRRAGSVRVAGSLGPWLHGVGRKVATRARSDAARRSARRERGLAAEAAEGPGLDPERAELLAGLDEEVARLPEPYRSAVVLCDLGGLSHREAASRLGCPEGTVASRLSRARERLRGRLSRRGLAPTPSVPVPVPAVPPGLALATARALVPSSPGEAATVAARVSALAKGPLIDMTATMPKLAAALALVAGLGMLAYSTGAAPEPQAPAPAAPPPGPDLPADGAAAEVLARMEAAYARARSYEDEGLVVQVFPGLLGKRTVEKPFSTLFVRPRLFRYEFSEAWGFGGRNRYVVWSDAATEAARVWWTIRPKVEETTLALALAGGSGISGSSARTVPGLLMPDVCPGTPWIGLKDPRLAGPEDVDGAACDRVEGKDLGGNPLVVWVDRSTSLLRKMSLRMAVRGVGEVEQTTTYRPKLDGEIPPARFEFAPPGR